MTKISSKSAYPIKKPISSDYFVGTDSESFGKTVNFGFDGATKVINELNGNSVLKYVFKTSFDVEVGVLEEGEFLSLSNETTIADVTKLYVNKFNKDSTNLSVLYDYLLINSGDFLFKLQGVNPNVYVYFNLVSIENHSSHYIFNVTVYKANVALTELVSFREYFFNFELKSTGSGGGGSDPLKLDKSTYDGNAQDLKDEIDAIAENLPTDYAKIVYVNSYSPNLATIFDLSNPPITNDNLLKEDVSNLYIANDTGSTWVWNTLITGYVTKSIPKSSNFFLEGSTTDSGNNKTSNIERVGAVGVGAATAPNHAMRKSQVEDADIATLNSANDYTDSKVVSVYVFKGNVANYAALPSSGQTIGWVWNLTDTGVNYAWTGTVWDELGATVDISGKANIASPTFTGIPSAPTAIFGTNTTQLANTAFVQASTNSVASAMYGTDVSLSSGQSPYTLQSTDANARITTNGVFNQNFSIVVPTNASVPFQIGTKIRINCSENEVGIVTLSGAGITFIGIGTLTPIIRFKESFEITKVATNTWYIDELSLLVKNGSNRIVSNNDAGFSGLFEGTVNANLTKSKFTGYTVATLPLAGATLQGEQAYVTDALSPTYLGALTGGGSVKCPVFFNGTIWVSH